MLGRAGLIFGVVAVAATGSASAAAMVVSNPPVLANIVVTVPGCDDDSSATTPITWTPERVCEPAADDGNPVADDVPAAARETHSPDIDAPADPQTDEAATHTTPLPPDAPLEGEGVGSIDDELLPDTPDRNADDSVDYASPAADGGSPAKPVDDEAPAEGDRESTPDA